MNWAWASSLDQFWRSPAFPMWLTLAAAGFFGIIVLITLLRAEKSVANGALTVITLLAIGIAVAATIRGFAPGSQQSASGEIRSLPPIGASLPALSCLDDLAGEIVATGCEKALFGSAESAAAAVSYAASQITRLTAVGDVATANKGLTPELLALRRAVEHDRYGLVAQALLARDHCTPAECAAFRSLTDSRQIAANMEGRVYDGLISRYAPMWNAPAPTAPVMSSSMPTGKPTNAEFPTAASTPAVSIMTPEPGTAPPTARAAAPIAASPWPSARPTLAPTGAAALASAAKKPPATKPPRAPAAVQVAPAAPAAPAPAASND